MPNCIKDIKEGSKNINIILRILELSEIINWDKNLKSGRLVIAKGQDKNNDVINVLLWNDKIDIIKKGDSIEILNGYARLDDNKKLCVTDGKYGRIKII